MSAGQPGRCPGKPSHFSLKKPTAMRHRLSHLPLGLQDLSDASHTDRAQSLGSGYLTMLGQMLSSG